MDESSKLSGKTIMKPLFARIIKVMGRFDP